MRESISYEYIRGLVEGEGCFTFSTRIYKSPDGKVVRKRIPAFSIGMHERDQELLRKVKNTLGLTNKVYNYQPYNRDGYNRGRKAFLIVRDLGSLKNIIIPLFYNKFVGHKAIQFNGWLEQIGTDESVIENFKVLYRLHKNGYFSRNLKFEENLVKREKTPLLKIAKT